MTDATPTQPTGSGKWIWRKPLLCDVVAFGTLPDPRDARIAELEAALREIEHWCEIAVVPNLTLKAIRERANAALMPAPERDMAVTVEELDA